MRIFLSVIFFLFVQDVTLASPKKVTVSFAQGLFSQSKKGISSSTILSPGLNVSFPISNKVVINTGLGLFLDFSSGSVFLTALHFRALYYFKERPFSELKESNGDQIKLLSKWAFAGGAEIKKYNYFLGNVETSSSGLNIEGGFMSLNLLAQADYRLNTKWELSSLASISMLNFATSENGIQLQSYLLSIGISYFMD